MYLFKHTYAHTHLCTYNDSKNLNICICIYIYMQIYLGSKIYEICSKNIDTF